MPHGRPTMEDLAAVIAVTSRMHEVGEVLAAVDALAKRTLGHHQCSIFRYVHDTAEVERIHTSTAGSHPLGGRKRIADYPHNQTVLARGDIYVAPDREAVARTYKDSERIFALGVTSIMNVPVRFGDTNIGALNLMGEAGWYGPEVFPSARVVANLLAPTLMAWRQ